MIFKRLKLKLLLALLICGSAYAQQRDAYVAIGDIYRSDGSIVTPEDYVAQGYTDGIGVVCYVDDTGYHGWVMYYKDNGSNIAWSSALYSHTGVPQKAAFRDFTTPANGLIKDCNGKANTDIIAELDTYSQTNFPAFFYAKSLGDGGWYVPAAGQLNYMVGQTGALNASLMLIEGSTCVLRSDHSLNDFNVNYWASDEYSGNDSQAWYMKDNCSFTYISKANTSTARVRAFHDF